MYKKHIERVEGNLYVGDNIYTRPVFIGDYSKCDCEEKIYNYRPVWVGVTMYAVVMAFWWGNTVSLLMSLKNGGFIRDVTSSQYVLAENAAFAALMVLIYLSLPFFGDMFKIYFKPKDGVMVVGREVISFDDVQKIEVSGTRKVLYLMYRSGKKRIIPFHGAEYVYTCISRLWGAQ